jgi:ribosomal protein L19
MPKTLLPLLQRRCFCFKQDFTFPKKLSYFTQEEDTLYASSKELAIHHRRHRLPLPNFSRKQAFLHKPRMALRFQSGDILEVTITKELEGHMFIGICLGVRKRSLSCPDTMVILRNVISKVGIEIIFSLFENRAYRIRFHDHLRKSFLYAKSKLFYLRHRSGNRATRS